MNARPTSRSRSGTARSHGQSRLERLVADRTAELQAALKELRAKEAFNFALFQYNPAATTVADREGRVVKSNLARRRAEDGLPALGEEVFAAWQGRCEVDMQAALREAIRTGDARDFAELKVGGRSYAVTIAPFPQGAVVLRTDITVARRAQEESRQKQEQLVQAQKMVALGTLVSGVAHELSNPSNVILLSLSNLRRLVDGLRPALDAHRAKEGDFEVGRRTYSDVRGELPELLDAAARAAERINTLIGDLKGFARKDAEDLSRPLDLNAAVRNAVALTGHLLRKSTDAFSQELDEALPPARGSLRRIEQVVVNLLTNACQALPDRRRAVRVRTWHDAAAGRAAIEVADEGVGIPAEQLAHVADPFFTTKHDSGGTGLGLAISDEIVRGHGGTLSFRSEVGKGTTVTLALPVPSARSKGERQA